MKILFVYPVSSKSYWADEFFVGDPLALEYLGAGLTEHHDVHLLDMRFEKNWQDVVKKFSPDIVGLTSYTFHVNNVKNSARVIKEIDPNILTVVGGHHATVSPHDFYEPYIDVVVKGEGVSTFKEIVKRREKGQSLMDLEGVSLNVNGEFKENRLKVIADLNSLPIPDRSIRNRSHDNPFRDIATLVTSQGCAFRCNFCSVWKATGGKYLTRNLQSIIEELKGIEEPYIQLGDDESFLNPQRMMQLAELIEKEGIKKRFFSHARVDTILNHPELFRKWKDIGLIGLQIGMESFREEDLKYFNKKTTIGQSLKAIELLKKIGIIVMGSFIVRQEFVEKDFDDYADFAQKSQCDITFFMILTPLPGTQLYKEQEANLITHDYDLFDLLHTVLPTKLPIKKFYREYHYLWIRINKQNMKGWANFVEATDETDYTPPDRAKLLESYSRMKHAYRDHGIM